MRGSTRQGFTLIELMVVMAIVATLLTIAVPRYFGSVDRAEIATLKHDLSIMRESIDQYFADHGHYPESLQALVDERYLREVPVDPITRSDQTWIAVPSAGRSGSSGVYDVRSGAQGATDGGMSYQSL